MLGIRGLRCRDPVLVSRQGGCVVGWFGVLGVVTANLQWKTEVCRDRVFSIATGFGCLVSRQGRACGRCHDRAPSARCARQSATKRTTMDAVYTHYACDRPATMRWVEHYFGHCTWALFTNTVHGHYFKKKVQK